MTNLITFYLSQVLGQKIRDENGNYIGRLSDLQVDVFLLGNGHPEPEKPKVTGIKLKYHKKARFISFECFRIDKIKDKVSFKCIKKPVYLSSDDDSGGLLLCRHVLDKQIVDLDGIKVVRVNDIRLAMVSYGLYAVAVDIGVSGLLRRIGIEKPVQDILSVFNARITAEYINWDDLATIDDVSHNITLSKTTSKLNTLHPSDLADILEELGKESITRIFSSLDNEKAADVLEELETSSQIHLIESMSVEKAADVLEKMPANEAADIIDELEDDKAELLLNEMDKESSEDVKDILEYPDNSVGSIMTTDFLAFTENKTVEDVLNELRIKKPESDLLYNLFITDDKSRLVATLSLRDLVISEPHKMLKDIMTLEPLSVQDYDRLDSLAEITEKYNLLAIPVIDEEEVIQGMVVIDDIVEDLLKKGRTNK